MAVERWWGIPALLLLVFASGCATPQGAVNPELMARADRHDALATSDTLEALIERGADSPADREYAYQLIRAEESDDAAYAFARAAVTGRLVQQRGLRGASQVGEVERWALLSRTLDPDFRDGAATRLLGTLYVIAPATFLEHGDSERGLEMLEKLAEEHPDVAENQLRLAEAYIALGDPEPAAPHLCASLAHRTSLRRDDQQLLDQLVATAGTPDCESSG
jgi:thioredoxin-like negative regulator of GroEL